MKCNDKVILMYVSLYLTSFYCFVVRFYNDTLRTNEITFQQSILLIEKIPFLHCQEYMHRQLLIWFDRLKNCSRYCVNRKKRSAMHGVSARWPVVDLYLLTITTCLFLSLARSLPSLFSISVVLYAYTLVNELIDFRNGRMCSC